MTEIYHSPQEEPTREGLFELYLECQQNGLQGFGDEVWEKLVELDRQSCKQKLEELRQELNESIKK
jgi:hypothetical protein